MKLSPQRSLLSLMTNKLNYYSNTTPTSLTLQQYFDFHKVDRKNLFDFTRRELLVRFANLVQNCTRNNLPRLFHTPSARRLVDASLESFESLLMFENKPTTSAQMERFNNQLCTISKRYRNVVETVSKALGELQQINGVSCQLAVSDFEVHACIDRLLLSHLAVRTLQNQYLSTFDATGKPIGRLRPRFSGVVDSSCDVKRLIRDAYETARELCEDYYQQAPLLQMRDTSVFITAEPSYLYHIVFEIVKNAMRATIEWHSNGAINDLPPIGVELQVESDNLVIKISDQGGGIPVTISNSLFNYTYTTATPSDAYITPFAGFGTGLPVSRLYACYFAGDLQLSSTEGVGTDALIKVKIDPNQAVESLPADEAALRKLTSSNEPRPPAVAFCGA